jgi:hypothetical protein
MTTKPSLASATNSETHAPPNIARARKLHQAFRIAVDELVVGIHTTPHRDDRRSAALLRWFTVVSAVIGNHHDIEDRLWLAALAERVPSYVEYASALAEDHDRIHVVLFRLHDALAKMAGSTVRWATDRDEALALAVELRDVLAGHLDFEDNEILPMFERHFTAPEYAAIERQARRPLPLRKALVTVPWWMATAGPDAASQDLHAGRVRFRVIYWLTRRHYARLVRCAFGPRFTPGR